MLHQRCPSVVVPDPGDHSGATRGRFDAHGLVGSSADRLLAEHRFASLGSGDRDLLVHHVRRRHIDHVDIGVIDDRAPVLDGLTKPDTTDGLLTPLGDIVAADNEGGIEDALREE